MNRFIEFSEIETGRFVKIAGKTVPDAGFLAVEIVAQPGGGAKLESQVESVAHDEGSLTMLGQTVVMNGADADGKLQKEFADLEAGDMVKIKGEYLGDHRFKPLRIKKKERLDFFVEELQGVVESVSQEEKTFVVNGVRIHLNEKTILLQD